MGRFRTYRPAASAVMSSIMTNVAAAATSVSPCSHRSSDRCTTVAGLGIVLLDGFPEIAEELAARQSLGLHALHPVIFHRPELRGPALALLRRDRVDRPARLLDRL